MPNRKVIGICQHHELLDIHFYNLALSLSKLYVVYVFTLNKDLEGEGLINLDDLKNVIFKNYHQKNQLHFQPKRTLAKFGFMPRQPLYLNELGFLINLQRIKFDFLIGIEKSGLALMHKIYAPGAVKIYHSLELYNDPPLKLPYDFKKLRNLEIKHHKSCDFTVIQDENRAKSIATYNKLNFSTMKWVYLPVSVKGEINETKSHYFHDRFDLESDKMVILNFGGISEGRHSIQVAEILNQKGTKFQTVFHGFGPIEVMDQIRAMEHILVSDDLVHEKDLNSLISSAYIGISIYNNEDDNNKLTILASERNARYCQNGIPFICLYSKETAEIYENHKCFEMIDHIEELSAAIDKIHDNYSTYRKNAYDAFDKYYSFDKNIGSLISRLEGNGKES